MKLTREMIDALRTNGAFTRPTITALGMEWATLRTGWIDRLVGQEMPEEQYERAKATVGVYQKDEKLGPLFPSLRS